MKRGRKPKQLPALIVLPAREEINQKELLEVLKISRVSLLNWRERFGMPAPSRKFKCENYFKTAEIANHLVSRGVEVRII